MDYAQEYTNSGAWGLHTLIDLHGCNPQAIRSPETVARFLKEIVDRIEMKAYGEPIILKFGDDPKVEGLSFLQLIETSLISGHIAEATDSVYLDIFSCKAYDPDKAACYAQGYFGARSMTHRVVMRG